ncbi:MAG: phosphoglycerate kinase [Flavobacteriales bacterium]|nr:phosphoglycerate kinase [Flavobacteriales bacterium]
MKTMDTFSFSGKKALIRVDFNVPLNADFNITDDTRIRAALPTIQKILKDGGAVILMSHLGRPKSGPEDKFSLKHLVNHLTKAIGVNVKFASDCVGKVATDAASSLQMGEVLLLENLRFHKEEEAGDRAFSEQLSQLGDVYVNDAFGTAHRAHASTTVVADFFPNDKLFGYLMAAEIESVDKVLSDSQRPVTAVMGGAKVSSKISIITNLIDSVDHIIIGGGMSYTFAKAMGGTVGKSLVEDDYLETAKKILVDAEAKGVRIHLPEDTIAGDAFDNAANKQTCATNAIPDGWMGLDIGPKTEAAYDAVLQSSNTILWNGPMGVFEMESFQHGTKTVALSIAKATKNGAFSLVGGGDSVAAINKFNLADEVSYVSTGGGALLEYMEGTELPGIKAIRG